MSAWRLKKPHPTNGVVTLKRYGYSLPYWRERAIGRFVIVHPADRHFAFRWNWYGQRGNRWMLIGVVAYFGASGLSWVWPVWAVRDAGEPFVTARLSCPFPVDAPDHPCVQP